MPRGHCGFAVLLIRKATSGLATLVGDVEAPTFCHLATFRSFHMGSSPKSIPASLAGRVRALDLDHPSGDRPDAKAQKVSQSDPATHSCEAWKCGPVFPIVKRFASPAAKAPKRSAGSF